MAEALIKARSPPTPPPSGFLGPEWLRRPGPLRGEPLTATLNPPAGKQCDAAPSSTAARGWISALLGTRPLFLFCFHVPICCSVTHTRIIRGNTRRLLFSTTFCPYTYYSYVFLCLYYSLCHFASRKGLSGTI